MVSISGAVTASFVYDGDGKRVKSIFNNETIYFIGGHYEFNDTTDEVTKYYGVYGAHGDTGTNRVAMRKYTISQFMTGEYLVSIRLRHSTRRLGDHPAAIPIEHDGRSCRVLG